MGKSTHFSHSTSATARIGGVAVSQKGAQDAIPSCIPNNWYPVNLPAASNNTPSQADCQTLLNTLRPLVAKLVLQQSVMLALVYRTVQSNVAPGSSFLLNGVTSNASACLLDSPTYAGEPVLVDVVNKNPTLTYDLALRLARLAAYGLDRDLLNLYGPFGNAAVGTANTTPTQANITAALTALPVTGEPVFGVFSSAVMAAMQSGAVLPNLVAPGFYNSQPALGGIGVLTGSAPTAANRMARFFASDNVPVTGTGSPTTHNQMFLPSALAMVTADLGTRFNTANTTPAAFTGSNLVTTSVALDPEFDTPQLAVQLIISNTGSGPQTVYVNYQRSAMLVNANNAIQVLA